MEAKEESAADKLNEKQKLFCVNYASNKETFANGVESYAEAYNLDLSNPKDYANAKVAASKFLTNSNILAYINNLLDMSGLNDEFIDKQLLLVITQNADMGSKVAGIREYNKLKQRITDKLDVKVSGGFDISLKLE